MIIKDYNIIRSFSRILLVTNQSETNFKVGRKTSKALSQALSKALFLGLYIYKGNILA